MTDGLTLCLLVANHRPFLPRAVRSLRRTAAALREAGIPYELLVIDDGSRDGSRKYLAGLAGYATETPFRTIWLGHPEGAGAVRDRAIREAGFNHVCFLDADRELIPENVARLYRAAIETGAVVVYGNQIVLEDGRAVAVESNECLHSGIFAENRIDGIVLIDRRQALDAGGHDATLGSHAPWELVLRLLSRKKLIVFVPVAAGYRDRLPDDPEPDENDPVIERLQRIHDQNRHRSESDELVGRMYLSPIGWIL
jgi:glycosyltransferase involved in cell wall biosynthesis